MTSLSKAEARHLLSVLKRIEKDLADLAQLRHLLETKRLIADQDVRIDPAWMEKLKRTQEDVSYVGE
jgi:t-SNARE complex subunit (syntaxin)